ncbi:MAG: type II toxin-antitoxin system VapB family antitoxin [Pseudolabrys sp.]
MPTSFAKRSQSHGSTRDSQNNTALSARTAGAIEDLVEEIMEIGRHCAALPLRDTRSPDEIIGYDEHGLPQ